MFENLQKRIGLIGPGILVAATGVGAGDLATAALTGATLGTSILWAVLLGAGLKFALNEGLARWQLATQTTLLEGVSKHMNRSVQWIFLIYLYIWAFLVAMALMSACGVAASAILTLPIGAYYGKIIYGILHSALAFYLVVRGGYALFERVMALCIGLMFCVVCVTAIALRPSWSDVLQGMLVPQVPKLFDGGLAWTIALLGGVGGTVTVLCYGYWIREEGRNGVQDLRMCRIDLSVGYIMTAIFGCAMVIIGSQLHSLGASGATLIVTIAGKLEREFGAYGLQAKYLFLAGAWGAIFSSLLGVWQSIPYLFADSHRLLNRREDEKPSASSKVYRLHLWLIASVPIIGLAIFDFRTAMKIYGVFGALFIPMLAIVLLVLNGNEALVGVACRNKRITQVILLVTLAISIVAGGLEFSNWFAN